MIYAGIGSRETPLDVLLKMTTIGHMLGQSGHTLRSGRARGADAAFEMGCDAVLGMKEIYVAQNKSRQPEWFAMAEHFHPAWDKCTPVARGLHARSSAIIMGDNLDTPADCVVAWTKGGQWIGGTAQGLRIAASYGIPTFNLAIDGDEARMWSFIYGAQ